MQAALRPVLRPLARTALRPAFALRAISKQADPRIENVTYTPLLRAPTNKVVNVVPQGTKIVVEQFGKLHSVLDPGLHFLLPWPIHRNAYMVSTKIQVCDVRPFMGVSKDNVELRVDAVVRFAVIDAVKAVYATENYIVTIITLAQTNLRRAIGEHTMNEINSERAKLNHLVVSAMADDAAKWGIGDLYCELRNVEPPEQTRHAMALLAETERHRQALITKSEGERQAAINAADGDKPARVLKAEGMRLAAIAEAQGKAEAVTLAATAQADAIERVTKALGGDPSEAAANALAEKYIEAFGRLAQAGNTIILEGSKVSDPAAMVAKAVGIFSGMRRLDEKF